MVCNIRGNYPIYFLWVSRVAKMKVLGRVFPVVVLWCRAATPTQVTLKWLAVKELWFQRVQQSLHVSFTRSNSQGKLYNLDCYIAINPIFIISMPQVRIKWFAINPFLCQSFTAMNCHHVHYTLILSTTRCFQRGRKCHKISCCPEGLKRFYSQKF